MAESVSDRMHDIDLEVMNNLGPKKVEKIMVDIHDRSLLLGEVAERNGVSMGTVCQVARFHKIDPVTLEPSEGNELLAKKPKHL